MIILLILFGICCLAVAVCGLLTIITLEDKKDCEAELLSLKQALMLTSNEWRLSHLNERVEYYKSEIKKIKLARRILIVSIILGITLGNLLFL